MRCSQHFANWFDGENRVLGWDRRRACARCSMPVVDHSRRAWSRASGRESRYGRRHVAVTLRPGPRPVALLVTSWGGSLDSLWRDAVAETLLRAATATLLFNGTHARLVETSRSFNRRYAEFELDQTLDDPRSFRALWTLVNSSSLSDLVVASDHHEAGVCRSLRTGVLAASGDILSALIGPRARGSWTIDEAFEQALTIVYRILFLLFAEARALVPLWHPTYRDSYSIENLREAVERPLGARGLWDALRAIARLAHAGCRAGDLRVTPFNGRLFAPVWTPLAERRNLDDEAARRAMLALSTRPCSDRRGRERIAYRDLGVEQLGAVTRRCSTTGRAGGMRLPRLWNFGRVQASGKPAARFIRLNRSRNSSFAGRLVPWFGMPRRSGFCS